MLNVGLTGNVAAGKSTVARHFAAWGATVIDADALVREAQLPGTPTLAAIVERFGRDVLAADGSLDRDALRRRILVDPAARAALDAIVHPAVRRRRAELADAARARGDLVLVNDIPLLFEAADPAAFDVIVLLDAPPALRRRRLVERRGLAPAEADRLIAAQLPATAKRAQSDLVIDNAGTVAALEGAAWEAWRTIRARAARRAAGDAPGPLLAVVAHVGDAALAAGTLARYGDAGVATHLACAGAQGPPMDAALVDLGGRLGLAAATRLEHAAGRLEPDDGAGGEAVARAIRQVGPAVILTVGREPAGRAPDHAAVHAWTRRAHEAVAARAALYFLTYPDEIAARIPDGAYPTDRPIAAALDIRPWRDVRRVVLATHPPPCLPHARERDAALEREWYAASDSAIPVRHDLYEGV